MNEWELKNKELESFIDENRDRINEFGVKKRVLLLDEILSLADNEYLLDEVKYLLKSFGYNPERKYIINLNHPNDDPKFYIDVKSNSNDLITTNNLKENSIKKFDTFMAAMDEMSSRIGYEEKCFIYSYNNETKTLEIIYEYFPEDDEWDIFAEMGGNNWDNSYNTKYDLK